MDLRQKALEFATRAHAGQKRKDGKDYIARPVAVAEIAENLAKEFGITEEIYLEDLYVSSLLHGVIEEFQKVGLEISDQFDEYFLENTKLLSHKKGETYFNFICRIVKHYDEFMDPIPLIVKISDITHNLKTLEEGPTKDKYRFAKHLLEKTLDSY